MFKKIVRCNEPLIIKCYIACILHETKPGTLTTIVNVESTNVTKQKNKP